MPWLDVLSPGGSTPRSTPHHTLSAAGGVVDPWYVEYPGTLPHPEYASEGGGMSPGHYT